MLRYMACIWNSRDPAQCAAAAALEKSTHRMAGWCIVHAGDGVLLLSPAAQLDAVLPATTSTHRLFVLGTLFSKRTNERQSASTLEAHTAATVNCTGGQILVDRYW